MPLYSGPNRIEVCQHVPPGPGDSRDLPPLLRGARPPPGGQRLARAGIRSDPDVRERRHGALQAHLPRRGDPGLQPRDDLAEMHARLGQAQRPRECRSHAAPSHLLRDARQLLLRRLFQGAGDRICLVAPDRARGLQPGPAGGVGLPGRRRGLRYLARPDRITGIEDLSPRREGEFLVDGRYGSLRSVLRDPLRLGGPCPSIRTTTRRARPAASWRSGISSSCNSIGMPRAR